MLSWSLYSRKVFIILFDELTKWILKQKNCKQYFSLKIILGKENGFENTQKE